VLEQVGQLGEDLSSARRKAAEDLSRMIESELSELRMEGARFSVNLHWEEEQGGAPVGDRSVAFGPAGLDQVEFLVEPNPGEGLKPLARIASGGETSRLMLGLKSVLAKADRTPTLIFDEIDQGIGGRVGAIVGRKMWGLARDHQVLCVTHLPQLSAFGDQHLKVEKILEAGRTVTVVNGLSDGERIPEMAQMLGGATESNLESAAELLRTAREQQEKTLAGQEATPT
jgi:DNA repair protein RecN (Recombination protein N)